MWCARTKSGLRANPFAQIFISQRSDNSCMGRKPRRKNFAKYMSGAINHELDLGGLLGGALVGSTLDQSVVDTTRISSVRATYTLNQFTPIEDCGPIVVGLAHGDYTNAEIEAWVESTGSWDMGNMVSKEIRSRRVRIVGVFDTPQAATDSSRLNDGKPIQTKLNWLLAEGDTLKPWVFNSGDAAVATTTPHLNIVGKANLWQV